MDEHRMKDIARGICKGIREGDMGSKELCVALCLTTVIVLDDAGMSREEQDEMLRTVYSCVPVGASIDDVNLN